MRRFELVEGSSSKFWEIQAESPDVTVRFGRIGTAGQAKTKSFADADAARKEHDKLVKEKTGKGYAEVGVASGATLAAAPASAPSAAPPAAPPPPSPPSPAVAPAAALPSVVAAVSTPASIDWPQGGFEWNDSLLAGVPVLRGVRVPPLGGADPLAALPIVLDNDAHGYYAKVLADLAARARRTWVPWGEQRSAELTTREHLARPDPAFWLELFAQALVLPHKTADKLMHY